MTGGGAENRVNKVGGRFREWRDGGGGRLLRGCLVGRGIFGAFVTDVLVR